MSTFARDPMIPVIEIDTEGDIHTLYTEEVDLQAIGLVMDVHRASFLIFDEAAQEWTVKDAVTGAIVHRTKRRSDALRFEIENFGPGGPLYRGNRYEHER